MLGSLGCLGDFVGWALFCFTPVLGWVCVGCFLVAMGFSRSGSFVLVVLAFELWCRVAFELCWFVWVDCELLFCVVCGVVLDVVVLWFRL